MLESKTKIMNDLGNRGFEQTQYEKKGFKPLKFCCLFVLIVLIGVGIFGFTQYQNYQAFVNGEGLAAKTGKFEVKEGENVNSITERLVKEGYLVDKSVFGIPAYEIFLKLNSVDSSNIHAGVYEITSSGSPQEIYKNLRAKACNELRVTLKEGWRLEEMAEELDKVFRAETTKSKNEMKFSKDEYIRMAKNFDTTKVTVDFKLPQNLEGYLFPDTYQFCDDSQTLDVIKKQLNTFNEKVYKSLETQLKQSKYSVDQVVNIASMIEREARSIEAKRNVADVILKRLNIGMVLGIDATTQYEHGYSTKQSTWWRNGEELNKVIGKDGPYNTRKRAGLPPTPISNPGFDSLKAVLDPIKNDYYFYITGNDGKMYYGKTIDEHNRNVAKYLR